MTNHSGTTGYSGTKTQAELRLRLFSISPSMGSTVRELSEFFRDRDRREARWSMRRPAGPPQDDENFIVEAGDTDGLILAPGDQGMAASPPPGNPRAA